MNIQSTRLKTDTEDNALNNRHKPIGTDFRGIAVLVAVGVPAGLLIWLVTAVSYAADCKWDGICSDSATYIFYGYNIFLAALMLVGLIYGAARLYQSVRNSAFIRGLQMPVHRDDIRANVGEAYKVEYRLAESEAFRGLDALTNSPSYHNNVKEAENNGAGIYSPHVKAQDEVDVLAMLEVLKGGKQ